MTKSFAISILFLCFLFPCTTCAQLSVPSFGKGLRITSEDSTFYLKVGFRFQTLYQNQWQLPNNDFSSFEDYQSSLFIRRSRLKFDGWALSPKLTYKAELSLSNRDNGGGNSSRYSNAANIILDAFIKWNFYKGFTLWAGQGKLPGNRERLVSSGNLQFVDRSRLNSRFTLDRDAGLMLIHKHKIGRKAVFIETFALTSGEGKNVTASNVGGYGYTMKVEAFPFGSFQSKGAYVGSAVKKEETPKLAIAVAYDINENAGRERGQKGDFILVEEGIPFGKNLYSFFADLMFKYQSWSVMAEYVDRKATDDNPFILNNEGEVINEYYTGSATNLAIGYMMPKNWEVALRWTNVKPTKDVANNEDQYTLGFSKFVVGHKLKVQTDVTLRKIDVAEDELNFRMQMDLHF